MERLNLNLHVYQSQMSPAQMETLYGRLWESDNVDDLNLYDKILVLILRYYLPQKMPFQN